MTQTILFSIFAQIFVSMLLVLIILSVILAVATLLDVFTKIGYYYGNPVRLEYAVRICENETNNGQR